MVRITKVYTKKGDKGTTAIAGKHRMTKTSCRIEAIGCLDELNAFLGWVKASLNKQPQFNELANQINRIQQQLFNLGAQIAVLKKDRKKNTPMIQSKDIKILELEIDQMNATLPILNSFILPGSEEISARLHIARTVCRRTERAVVALSKEKNLDGTEIPYINRLSDWLFVTARFVAMKSNAKEILWQQK